MRRPANAFLRRLGDDSFARLAEQLVPVDLTLGQVLAAPDRRVEHVYFPETCLLSVLVHARNGDSVETAMVGTEGALLLLEACGSGVSTTTCAVQADGRAWRAPAAFCRRASTTDPEFARDMFSLLELQQVETRQSALCQGVHQVEQRLARWLLECSERAAGRNPMPLTQEFIGAMLGVQRTTVTEFAGQLQKAGLIRYSRGRVELLDTAGLADRACECRSSAQEQRSRLDLRPSFAAAAA